MPETHASPAPASASPIVLGTPQMATTLPPVQLQALQATLKVAHRDLLMLQARCTVIGYSFDDEFKRLHQMMDQVAQLIKHRPEMPMQQAVS